MSRALKLRDGQTARQTDATTAEQITALAQNQNVLGAVLSGADGPRAIAKALSTSSRSQAARRLSQLRSAGLIGPRGELVSIARSYARLLLEALRWDLRGRPQGVADASARLLLTVHLITPLVEHPFPEDATCRLIVTDSPRAKLVLQLRGTQLHASRHCDDDGPALEITSSATNWCATLLGDNATRTREAPGCEQALLAGFRTVL
jgi:hypothetical protein